MFLGRDNGIDESEPAIAVDAAGTTYLAYATTNPSRVALAVLPANAAVWSEPVIVSGAETASSPALLLVGNRLVVAYRTPHGVDVSAADLRQRSGRGRCLVFRNSGTPRLGS